MIDIDTNYFMNIRDNSAKVSIVLATYNGAKYISKLLDSIEQQTLQPVEIVVCDDGSQDNTLSIVNQYAKRLPLVIQSNDVSIGVVQNFKRGVRLCTGDYIAFCDQDDVWLPHKLDDSVSEIKKLDGDLPALVFTDLVVVDQNLEIISSSYWNHRRLRPQKETFASLLYGNIVTGCTMLINRSMAVEVANMPPNVIMHDFWITCIAYGIGKHSFINSPTVLYRQHSTNVTNNDAVTWLSRLSKNISFLTHGEENKLFLMPHIQQAQSFLELYGERLSELDKRALRQLIKLKNKLPILRKWETFLVKSLRIIPNSVHI